MTGGGSVCFRRPFSAHTLETIPHAVDLVPFRQTDTNPKQERGKGLCRLFARRFGVNRGRVRYNVGAGEPSAKALFTFSPRCYRSRADWVGPRGTPD